MAIQYISAEASVDKTNLAICWIAIYPLDSVIHISNNHCHAFCYWQKVPSFFLFSDRNAETKIKFRFSISYENEIRKTETVIWILLSKVVENQKTKTDGSNSIFNVVGKRKTKTESRIPFSDDVGKRKAKLEVRIPFSYFAGKRLALRYTHSIGSREAV